MLFFRLQQNRVKWVWVKIRYPNNWMVNTKLDFSICGPLGLPFWPTSKYQHLRSRLQFRDPWISQILTRSSLRSPGRTVCGKSKQRVARSNLWFYAILRLVSFFLFLSFLVFWRVSRVRNSHRWWISWTTQESGPIESQHGAKIKPKQLEEISHHSYHPIYCDFFSISNQSWVFTKMFRQQKYGRSLSICFLDISSHLGKSIVAQLYNNHPKSTKRVTPNLNLNHHSLLFFPTWLQQNPHFARIFPWTSPNLLVATDPTDPNGLVGRIDGAAHAGRSVAATRQVLHGAGAGHQEVRSEVPGFFDRKIIHYWSI